MLWSDIVVRTQAQCKQDILTMLVGVGFENALSWHEGSIPLAAVEIGALIWSKFSEIAVALKKAHTLADAEDEALDAYGDSQYNEKRVGASSAEYLLKLSCEAGEGPHNIDIGDVVATNGEYTYRNIAGNGISYPYSLAGGGFVWLRFQAEMPGSAPTVAAATINKLQTTFTGVTITDGSLQTSGLDKESNPSYKNRCRTKWPTLSEGETIAEHVVNICLNADTSIKRATVDDNNPRGNYTADVYLAGESGTVGSGAVTAAQADLDLRFFSSNTVKAFASAADPLAISGTIYYDPSFSAAAAQAAVEAAIAEFFKTIPVGGFMYGSGLDHVVTTDDVRNAVRAAKIDGVKVVRTFAMTAPASNHTVSNFDVVTQGSLSGLAYVAATS